MGQVGDLMMNKSMDFAIRIVNLYKWLCEEKKVYVLSKQLLRSGISIGANLAEAQAAISKPDFIAKVYISAKECREKQYWIELLHRTHYLDAKQYSSIYEDATELGIDSMLYPRLMLTDNMEDKGMEEERSRNFQRVVVNRLRELSESKTPHSAYQLIFATSNIAPELEKPEYTIGDSYTKDNKSLKNIDF